MERFRCLRKKMKMNYLKSISRSFDILANSCRGVTTIRNGGNMGQSSKLRPAFIRTHAVIAEDKSKNVLNKCKSIVLQEDEDLKKIINREIINFRSSIDLLRPRTIEANLEQEFKLGESSRVGLIGFKRGISHFWDTNGRIILTTVLEITDCTVLNSTKIPVNGNGKILVNMACRARTGDPDNLKRKRKREYYKCDALLMTHRTTFKVTPGGWLPAGFVMSAAHLVPGQIISIRGRTISKGFQGVMKRWKFKGMPAGHGVRFVGRHGGSIGSSTTPGRVIKGKKMPGRMGGKYLSKDFRVYKIDPVNNLIYVLGLVQGPNDRPLIIKDCNKLFSIKNTFPKNSIIPFPTVPNNIKSLPHEFLMPKSYNKPDPYLKS